MKRVDATEKAINLLNELKAKHGDLMLYQAGGCCEERNHNVSEKENFTSIQRCLHWRN
jgi:uncharacterized protein (DUF779 family)